MEMKKNECDDFSEEQISDLNSQINNWSHSNISNINNNGILTKSYS